MPTEPVVGVVLAGGRSSRMGGGDKALRPLGQTTLLGHVLARFRPQVAAIVLNANGDPARFAGYGLPVVPDSVPDFSGPLAGVLAGMEWTRATRPDVPWIVTTAADAPFVPADLVARLIAERGTAELVVAASNGRTHPVVGLWPVRLADVLRHALVEEGMRKIDRWTARFPIATVSFAAEPIDPFFNINTPEELAAAQALLRPAEKVRPNP
jgi:molybdopterin-guanine dinucleotide biosynthesis protein A